MNKFNPYIYYLSLVLEVLALVIFTITTSHASDATAIVLLGFISGTLIFLGLMFHGWFINKMEENHKKIEHLEYLEFRVNRLEDKVIYLEVHKEDGGDA